MKIIRIVLIFVCLLGLAACNTTLLEEHKTVEGFITITTERINGSYEESGYKKVNAITQFRETKQTKTLRLRMIEDYYDLEGRYIKTRVYDGTTAENKMLLTKETDEVKDEYEEPMTIHLPDGVTDYSTDQLSEEQLKEIEAHVLQTTEGLM